MVYKFLMYEEYILIINTSLYFIITLPLLLLTFSLYIKSIQNLAPARALKKEK